MSTDKKVKYDIYSNYNSHIGQLEENFSARQ